MTFLYFAIYSILKKNDHKYTDGPNIIQNLAVNTSLLMGDQKHLITL